MLHYLPKIILHISNPNWQNAQQQNLLKPPPKCLKVTLRRSVGDAWTSDQADNLAPGATPNPGRTATVSPLNLPTTSVAENVSSFLSGIRASFRSENTNVESKLQSKRMSQPNNTTHESNV